MAFSSPLGIFGGTFDPIHFGHIKPIVQAAAMTNIEQIALMPCFVPSHKESALASSTDRLSMVSLVCEQFPIFYPEAQDIKRGIATYSIDSLIELRAIHPTRPLCFFIGTDSLQTLHSWYRWQDILEYCHFVVCKREGTSVLNLTNNSPQHLALQTLLQQRQTENATDLCQHLAGKIFIAETLPFTISSSELKQKLLKQQDVSEFIPVNVLNYIRQHKLYQPSDDLC